MSQNTPRPPYSPYPQQPQKTHKPLSRSTKIGCGAIVAIFVLLAIITNAIGGGSNNSTATTDTQATQPVIQNQPKQASTPTPQPKQVPIPVLPPTPRPTTSLLHFGDGTYQVGKDIKPGTYRTRIGSPGCYYARLGGFGGTVDEIIANSNTDAPAIVTIATTDKGFEAHGCDTWTKDLSQITTSRSTFSDGMYFIGTDIAPGTYRNTGVNGCYFARLRSFGNTTDDIIANNNVDTVTIVTLADSDKGFQSHGCGTWTRQ